MVGFIHDVIVTQVIQYSKKQFFKTTLTFDWKKTKNTLI